MASQRFVPRDDIETKFSFERTPTYLFRTYGPNSVGFSSPEYVASSAWVNHYEKQGDAWSNHGMDLLQLSDKKAAEALLAHLKPSHGHGNSCNLMSWSSSLLFALQFALYHHIAISKRPLKADKSDIYLIMLDTREFKEGTFLRDLDAIDHYIECYPQLSRISEWRHGKYYFGEYLTQGRLDIEGRCSQVSMKQLEDRALYTICPMLDIVNKDWNPMLDRVNKDWNRLANAVSHMRKRVHKRGFNLDQVADRKHIRLAIVMAQSIVDERFVVPFSIMLLAIQHRQDGDQTIFNSFRAVFTDAELTFNELKYDQEDGRIRELRQFREFMKSIMVKGPEDHVTMIS